MFTLRAGPALKPFRVHKQLLSQISSELRGHVFNDMKEGLEGSMDMAHVSEDTMCQLLEFFYTGDYSIPECSNEISTQHLLPNAKLYVLGDMYNIPGIKDAAFGRIQVGIIAIGYPDSNMVGALVGLLKYAFENLPERKEMDPLLRFLGEYAAWALKGFMKDENFLTLFAGNGRIDLIKLIFNTVEEARESPWGESAKPLGGIQNSRARIAKPKKN